MHDERDAAGTGRYSVALPRPHWYPACTSAELGRRKPLAIELLGSPLVVFRDGAGHPGVLVDRCPHRNAPLSVGRVRDGALQCAYHGWRFDGSGSCVAIPGLDLGGGDGGPARAVTRHATVERDGIVWFWSEPGEEPAGEPFRLPDLGPGMRQVVLTYDIDATMHAAIENTLDVPHTAFLHRGLLRGAEPNEITAVRRPIPGGVEVQYFGEPFGIGFVRLQGGEELEHYDRFVLPCVAQVEYRAGRWLQIVNSVLHLPLGPFRTRAWFVLRANSQRLPSRLVEAVIRLQGPRVARQDVRMLGRQTDTVRRFGGERYTSTEMDLFGNAVWRLLRHAGDGPADGEAGEPPVIEERTVTFRA
jgi:phenylpropionate dioxygenase-like ring-hydroxylating dioxygenase large terminal subunit